VQVTTALTLIHTLCNSLQHALNLLVLLCSRAPSSLADIYVESNSVFLRNGFQRRELLSLMHLHERRRLRLPPMGVSQLLTSDSLFSNFLDFRQTSFHCRLNSCRPSTAEVFLTSVLSESVTKICVLTYARMCIQSKCQNYLTTDGPGVKPPYGAPKHD
jgi:hypothetical protein